MPAACVAQRSMSAVVDMIWQITATHLVQHQQDWAAARTKGAGVHKSPDAPEPKLAAEGRGSLASGAVTPKAEVATDLQVAERTIAT